VGYYLRRRFGTCDPPCYGKPPCGFIETRGKCLSRMEIDAGVLDFETTLEEAEEYHLPSRADLFFGTDSGTD